MRLGVGVHTSNIKAAYFVVASLVNCYKFYSMHTDNTSKDEDILLTYR